MGAERKFMDATWSKVNLLENRLADALKPIRPRQEFVRSLNRRIQSIQPPAIVDRLAELKFVLLALAGIVSVGVLIVLGIRALANLFRRKPFSNI